MQWAKAEIDRSRKANAERIACSDEPPPEPQGVLCGHVKALDCDVGKYRVDRKVDDNLSEKEERQDLLGNFEFELEVDDFSSLCNRIEEIHYQRNTVVFFGKMLEQVGFRFKAPLMKLVYKIDDEQALKTMLIKCIDKANRITRSNK
jgi:hypothetical protein